MTRTFVIGDIHGCYAELQELLGKAGLSSSDEIIALGDVVEKTRRIEVELDLENAVFWKRLEL